MFSVSPTWKSTYPEAIVGVLAMGNVANPSHHPGLEEVKAKMESELRSRYAGYDRAQLKGLPVLEAYRAYYSQFRKTYHVQLQLESIAFKGKSIPRVAALVEATRRVALCAICCEMAATSLQAGENQPRNISPASSISKVTSTSSITPSTPTTSSHCDMACR